MLMSPPQWTIDTVSISIRSRVGIQALKAMHTLWCSSPETLDRINKCGPSHLLHPGNTTARRAMARLTLTALRLTFTPVSSGGTKLISVDFKEEFSAFHGETLREQARYLVDVVTSILTGYQPGTAVTLVGHSMGGIVARLALADANFWRHVDLLLTLSTPHILPPVTLSWGMERVYRDIWLPTSSGPLIISLCGGISDTEVVSDGCAMEIPRQDGFSTFTSGIPGVWTAIDHQAMVWCHQLRWTVARVLLEVSGKSRPIQLGIARKWFLEADFRSDAVSTLFYTPEEAVSSVQLSGADKCRQSNGLLIPVPKNMSNPFPLVGEGIKPEEVMCVLDIGAGETAKIGQGWEEGPHLRASVDGLSWGKSTLGFH
jgi:pimeloyl-ACP methyl ester carboxylesterase